MIITKTPLRISLLGGNTDFREYYLKHGGCALSTTIDKYIYCIVKKRFDDLIIVNYTIKETVENVWDLKHELVREALNLVGIKSGIEITFLADIPTQGSGLGSSSAVTVGVLNALHTYLGENVDSEQLATEAIKIELEILSKPIGVQDQFAVALGGFRMFDFLQDGGMHSQKVPMIQSVKEDFNNSLMLLYTGITRKTEDVLSGFDTDKNKLFLDTNKMLADSGLNSLLVGDLKTFGDLLNTYWETKKFMNSKVTNSEIDQMYSKAKEAGAIGGKIIGAGAGGFLLVMFPAHKRAAVRSALNDYKELPFRFSDEGSKILLNI